MASTRTNVIVAVIVLALFLAIPILIGVYVYRDAMRRRMNAVLWTLIAIFAPYLIGFIIYLLVRGNHSDLMCPRCDTPVTEQYVVCPNCGARLHPLCPSCAQPVERTWKVCPHCAQPLPETLDGFEEPVRRKDTALGKILIVLILVPIGLILLLLVIGYSNFSRFSGHVSTFSGGSGSTGAVLVEYEKEQLSKAAGEIVLPERVSVVKLVRGDPTDTVKDAMERSEEGVVQAHENVGTHEISGEDDVRKLLSAIDSAPYLDLEDPIYEDSDFTDGFDVIIEYEIHEEFILHEDMRHCLVFEKDGKCYLGDDRVDNARFFRQMDDDFYRFLTALFDSDK